MINFDLKIIALDKRPKNVHFIPMLYRTTKTGENGYACLKEMLFDIM